MLTKLEIKKLKKELPRGYAEMVAKEFGVTKSYVNYVASGSRQNIKILNRLIAMAQENKKNKQKTKENIKSL